MFNAFHHFPPHEARQILEDAHRGRQPILVFEMTERTLWNVLTVWIVFFLALWLLPRAREGRWWWVWTYLLPVLPLVLVWDTLVSHLRTYSDAELLDLTRGLQDQYRWSTGSRRLTTHSIAIRFLIGTPVECPHTSVEGRAGDVESGALPSFLSAPPPREPGC